MGLYEAEEEQALTLLCAQILGGKRHRSYGLRDSTDRRRRRWLVEGEGSGMLAPLEGRAESGLHEGANYPHANI